MKPILKILISHINRRNFSSKNILNLKERGIINDIFPKNASEEIHNLTSKPQCVYAGFDPTADSLHVGNLLILFNLIWWQRAGHNVIALVGGATAQIGDPSGKTIERDELALKIVQNNSKAIQNNIETIFNNHQRYFWKNTQTLNPLKVVDNSEWYSKMSAVELCGRIGRHMRLGTMLGRSCVQTRLKSEDGMSFSEFCYPMFQAYDWLYLYQNFQCTFQVGGSDQMGNIVAGHDLISRITNFQVYGLTLPLITNEAGNKFGKSEGTPIWLDSSKTSAFDFYQFFIRTKDSQVEQFLQFFTFEKEVKIKEIMEEQNKSPEKRIAQTHLASYLTLLVHGEEGLALAKRISNSLYSKDPVLSLQQLNSEELRSAFSGATFAKLNYKPNLTTLTMALEAKCFKNEDEANRIISAGGFYINSQRIRDVNHIVDSFKLTNGITLLRVGKKNYTIIEWTN